MAVPSAVTKAADYYLTHQPIADAISKELDEAKRILKTYLASRDKTSYRGIGYSATSYDALDVGLARLALGPKKTAACTVTRSRETLTLPPHLRRGAVLLGESKVG